MFLTLLQVLRNLVSWVDLIIFTLLMYLLSFLPNTFLKSWYRSGFQYWCKIFIRALGVSLFLHQKNHFSHPKQYILIGNHPSVLEDLGMPSLFDVTFLAKSEVKHWWLVGRIGAAAGTFYVNRTSKLSRKQSLATLKHALQQGKSVGLYPEGGCKGRRVFTPFRYGAFDLSLQTGVPIVPVFLHYEAQETFEWQNQHLIKKLWQIFKAQNHRANYYVFDAIDPKQFKSKEEFCEHVQNQYLSWQKQYLE